MSKGEAKSLSQLIGSGDSGLGQLAARARRQADLSEHMRNGLGADLADGVIHCNCRDDGTLVVLASSPEWASRLRFEERRLLQLCREFGSPATSVKVRIGR